MEEVPEEDVALHDAKLVPVVGGEGLFVEDVGEDAAGLLGVSLPEGLVQSFD